MLASHERPRVVRRVATIPMTEGFGPIKARARAAGLDEGGALQMLRWSDERGRYL